MFCVVFREIFRKDSSENNFFLKIVVFFFI